MSQASVALTIGGHIYRVRAAASEQELRRLAATVDARLRSVAGTAHSTPPPQTLLLVAISLAHDLENERAARSAIAREAHDVLQFLLERVDSAIGNADATLARMQSNSSHAEES